MKDAILSSALVPIEKVGHSVRRIAERLNQLEVDLSTKANDESKKLLKKFGLGGWRGGAMDCSLACICCCVAPWPSAAAAAGGGDAARKEAHSASGRVCHGRGAWAPHKTAVAYLGEKVRVKGEGWGVGFGAGMKAGAAAAHRGV